MRISAERAGFSLIEVLIATLILSVGMLAMGTSTGYVMTQIQASELRGERMAAVRQAAEILGGTDWATIDDVCAQTAPFSTANYTVDCEVEQDEIIKRVKLISVGPAIQSGQMERAATDTFTISLANLE